MKFVFAAALISVGVAGLCGPAEAAGCIKGAAVGGVAGHVAGHHGLLGAAAGCVVGRHEANRTRQNAATPTNAGGGNPSVVPNDNGSSGSSSSR